MQLLSIFQKICESEINQQEINFLVETSYKIALHYLRGYYKKLHKILQHDDLSLNDFAIDAIAPLFQRDENNSFSVIKKSFENWKPEIKTEADAEYFLNKITAKNVLQRVSSLLKNSDPFFAKILDSINYLIRKEDFKKIDYLGHVYIVESNAEVITNNIIDAETFDNLPSSLFADQKKLLTNIFHYLKTETKFYPAIPLNQLILKIKHLNISSHLFPDSIEGHCGKLEMAEKVNAGLLTAKQKLVSTYLNNNKINKDEAGKFENVLVDISVDLMDGGMNPGLYGYLEKHFTGLTRELYEENYHNIIEYLLRVMKSTIVEELNK